MSTASRQDSPRIDQLSSIRADGSRLAIHPADVHGRFITRRRIVFAVLMAIYVALPLVDVGGHPAVHLDVAARRFYLFGGTYNAQDFWRVLFLVTSVGFGLLFSTAWLGRVWCGWACPQTVFLEGVYRPIERFFDGPRERRLKQAGSPWTVGRVARAVAKHGAYMGVSLLISHAALSLFVSAGGLVSMVAEGPAASPVAFGWAMAVTGGLYFNFAWFREQLCVVVCPYGRLQSAMQDRDSIIVGYDAKRGEPRGRMLKVKPGEVAPPRGDCVDCRRCVAVCPTGIDIRNGLQMDCLACAQCVDACDEVMDKVGRPRGLIRYDSLNGLAGEKHRVLRPRLVLYGALMVAAFTGLVLSLVGRVPFEANLLRFQGTPYLIENGTVRNQFELHLVNKNPDETTFTIRVDSPVPAQVVVPQAEVKLSSLESFRVPLFITVQQGRVAMPFVFHVEVKDSASGEVKRMEARFLGPASQGG
ncbi:cytochrome c oxidase accessory protein CcoG [Pyxidicoccus fallax]|uniref:Cytochrome c oxidase accessory protein CcoG n=1 Tax=Pyxidicoccus fallax TaxID=394095 RepID=A0A848LVZ0_9BACT|nr:cytochrome c oxidase accessory protein CcoG [Pyxidicoccus fallax]NMO21966.1 cytochrome c oxidase accessory protein CcoG [Pyxidicoccus fallax]NPC83437.1 cytochrome c oxidase accessory protein CcoG [Pyxidicoccus fallax]